jgi:hypothetical protein
MVSCSRKRWCADGRSDGAHGLPIPATTHHPRRVGARGRVGRHDAHARRDRSAGATDRSAVPLSCALGEHPPTGGPRGCSLRSDPAHHHTLGRLQPLALRAPGVPEHGGGSGAFVVQLRPDVLRGPAWLLRLVRVRQGERRIGHGLRPTTSRHRLRPGPSISGPARRARPRRKDLGLFRPVQQIRFDHTEQDLLREYWASWAALISYYLLAVPSIFGWILLRRRRVPTFPLVALVCSVVVTVALTFGQFRYRAMAEVALVVLAAVALDSLGRGNARTSRVGSKPVEADVNRIAGNDGDLQPHTVES